MLRNTFRGYIMSQPALASMSKGKPNSKFRSKIGSVSPNLIRFESVN